VDTSPADSFLHLIRNSRKGKLKIYLGYAAGVGKTWQMLKEAQQLHAHNIDIAAGLVETHNSNDADELLSTLEIIPPKRVIYRSIEIAELDIDAILERKPTVVLVDDLAHTNIPGSRNSKRYEDVEEILAAGIHVISTLNIQHLESHCETVEVKTGVKVKNHIPNRILELADEVVNVDISTFELRRRLEEANRSLPGHLGAPHSDYYRKENLEYLREMTLREAALQAGSRRRRQLSDASSATNDRLMVCLSSNKPDSDSLLRYASAIAGGFNKNWYAIHVQTITENSTDMDAGAEELLAGIVAFARELGATVFTCKGDDRVKTILQFAREYKVGHIIIGSSKRKRSFWHRLKGKKETYERLINESCGIRVTAFNTEEMKSASTEIIPSGDARKSQSIAPGTEQANKWKELVMNAPVILLNGVMEKEQAFQRLIHEACIANSDLNEMEVMKSLLERETQGATFVGSDIAIPHARLENLTIPMVVIGVNKKGVVDRQSGNSARIIFLLLTPISDPDSHIKMLGVISRLAADSQWRAQTLREAGTM
jgi:two-component system sensor histidine kinase KdpD